MTPAKTPTPSTKARTVMVGKNLKPAEGREKGIKAAIRQYGGDYRGATYDPTTGKCKVM